jgi:hypothetical protein
MTTNLGRPAFVIWHDAHQGSSTWTHLEDIHTDRDPYVVTSVGFLLEEKVGGKPGHVSLVQSWSEDDALDSVLHIPTAMVQYVYFLKGPLRVKGKGNKNVDEARGRTRS